MDDLARMLADYVDQRDRQGTAGRAAEVLVTATPGIAKHAAALDELGVHGVIVPAVTLATTATTDDIIGGMERYAARW